MASARLRSFDRSAPIASSTGVMTAVRGRRMAAGAPLLMPYGPVVRPLGLSLAVRAAHNGIQPGDGASPGRGQQGEVDRGPVVVTCDVLFRSDTRRRAM